jgi:ubiquinone/menaquinone biosynthesis C-methylase UbiE
MRIPDDNDYVLRGGDQGAVRLRLLAAVKWPTTMSLLHRIGLRQGMQCLDVGCGIGAVTLRMAEIVGPTGRAVGLDMDERCLELARLEAHQLGSNAEFRCARASDPRENSAYDLVFGRFVLTHLPEPEKALERMVQAARPHGVVLVEDIQFSGHFCYPPCPAFDRYVSLYQEVVRRKGGDPNIGPRLPGMFLDAGLADVDVEVIQPTYRQGPGKQIAAVTMEHIREKVVIAGLASDEEINGIVAECDSFASNPRTVMSLPRIFQVWGRTSA